MKPKHAFGWMFTGVTILAGQHLVDSVGGWAREAVYAQPVATARQVVKSEPIGPRDLPAVQVASAGSFRL